MGLINTRGALAGLGNGLAQVGQILLNDQLTQQREQRMAKYRQQETAAANAHQAERDTLDHQRQTERDAASRDFTAAQNQVIFGQQKEMAGIANAYQTERADQAHSNSMAQLNERNANDRYSQEDRQRHDFEMMDRKAEIEQAAATAKANAGGTEGRENRSNDELQKAIAREVDAQLPGTVNDLGETVAADPKKKARIKSRVAELVKEYGEQNIAGLVIGAQQEDAHNQLSAITSFADADQLIEQITKADDAGVVTGNIQSLIEFLKYKKASDGVISRVAKHFSGQ